MTTEIISGTDAWRNKKGLGLMELLVSVLKPHAEAATAGPRTVPGRETLSEYLKRKPLGTTTTAWPTVSITSGVRDFLDNDLYDGAEIGGYLYGPANPPEGEILITHAVIAARDDRTATSVVLDLDKALRVWNELPADMTLRGDVHCHPNDGHANPSSADLSSWERSAQVFERDWIGLVVRTAPVRVFGRETSRFEINATLTRYENGRADHRSIQVTERSY